MPLVSLIVPTKNEERAINNCITTAFGVFATRKIDGEIIVADNSNDKTPEIAKSLGATVFTPKMLGYGNALIYAINQSKGKIVVLSDADRSYDLADMPRIIEPIINIKADLVIGTRLKGDIKKGAMPFLHRYIGNPLITYILNKNLGTHITDAHCGMRAFTKESWDKIDTALVPEDFCSEMLRQYTKQKAVIAEVPISYFPRDGVVKAGTILHGYRCFRFLLVHVVLDK